MAKGTILTGIRANSDLHLGNYFGGLLPMVDMAKSKSDEYKVNLFVPDLHSFTTPIEHDELQNNIMANLRVFVAAGMPLNNNNVNIYRQSRIPAHSELAWVLSCFTSYGEMSRMTQFKDKSDGNRTTVGLFSYPILMAADILLYEAKYVPVGDDQTQHIEFTRNIAERINNKFNKDIFKLPVAVSEQHKFFQNDQGLRIKDLANPEKKMSKSSESGKGVIVLTDPIDISVSKVLKAATDNMGTINYDTTNQPGISNLLELNALLSGNSLSDIEKSQWIGQSDYASFKESVAEKLKIFLEEFQMSLKKVEDSEIIQKLENSEKQMNVIANNTLQRVQEAVGLR